MTSVVGSGSGRVGSGFVLTMDGFVSSTKGGTMASWFRLELRWMMGRELSCKTMLIRFPDITWQNDFQKIDMLRRLQRKLKRATLKLNGRSKRKAPGKRLTRPILIRRRSRSSPKQYKRRSMKNLSFHQLSTRSQHSYLPNLHQP